MWHNNTIKMMVVQTMKQETFTDIEYSFRKKKTRREEFLEIMDEIILWDEWVGVADVPKGADSGNPFSSTTPRRQTAPRGIRIATPVTSVTGSQ